MIPADSISENKTAGWQRALALALFCAAFVFMIYRGPVRALGPGGSSDFSLIWQSTRAFSTGLSPYEVPSIEHVWNSHSFSAAPPPSERNAALLVYPPSTFVLMTPWCSSDWATGRLGWMLTGTLLLLATIGGCLRLAGLSWHTPRYWLAAAAALALAPGHTCISVGQPSLLVMFLIVVAQVLRDRPPGRHPVPKGGGIVAGIALGLACALKPQIGLIFLAYEVGRLRWRTAITGAIVAGVVLAIGIWKLHASGIDWLPQWRANLAAFAASDNADPTSANPLRYHLINLHYWLHTFTDNRGLVKWLVYALVAALCGAYFLADRRALGGTAPGGTALPSGAPWTKPQNPADLLTLSFLAAISMLIVYHRLYDAVVLLFPLVWLFAEPRRPRRMVWAAVMGLCLLAFYVPGASLMNSLVVSGKIPPGIANSIVFTSIAMPHAVIALVGLAICAIAMRALSTSSPSGLTDSPAHS